MDYIYCDWCGKPIYSLEDMLIALEVYWEGPFYLHDDCADDVNRYYNEETYMGPSL